MSAAQIMGCMLKGAMVYTLCAVLAIPFAAIVLIFATLGLGVIPSALASVEVYSMLPYPHGVKVVAISSFWSLAVLSPVLSAKSLADYYPIPVALVLAVAETGLIICIFPAP